MSDKAKTKEEQDELIINKSSSINVLLSIVINVTMKLTRFFLKTEKTVSNKEKRRRSRFLFSKRAGLRQCESVVTPPQPSDALSSAAASSSLQELDTRLDTSLDKRLETSLETSLNGDLVVEDPVVTSNLYHQILLGKNWFRYLQEKAPEIPKTLPRSVWERIGNVNISSLQAKFGNVPCRSDLPKIEEYLDIDLYLLYGGKYSPLGISYRPYRASGPPCIRSALEHLDAQSFGRLGRPVVVLQSARPYFHTLGSFYVIPTRRVAQDYDKNWTTFWLAIVRFKYGKKLTQQQEKEKISYMKRELCLANDEKFTLSDGIFRKLRLRFAINVALYVSNIINDNVNDKRCYYSTFGEIGSKRLHILVASYNSDKFLDEFQKFANISYDKLVKEPWRNPILAADRDFRKKEAAAAATASLGDPVGNPVGVGSSSTTEDEDLLLDLTDDVHLSDEDADDPFILKDISSEDEDNNKDDDDETAAAAAAAEVGIDAGYRPIRNLPGLVPSVFDDDTLVRVLEEGEYKDMPRCPTKNCAYSHERKAYMDSHIKKCTRERKRIVKQVIRGGNINNYIEEIVAEKFLPSVSFSQDFYCTYDIECLMTNGGLSPALADPDRSLAESLAAMSIDDQFHNVATIANMTSSGEMKGFVRKNMNYESLIVMVGEYVKYLLVTRQDMVKKLPVEIHHGIEYYSFQLYDKEERQKFTIEERARIRKKLFYLRDFLIPNFNEYRIY